MPAPRILLLGGTTEAAQLARALAAAHADATLSLAGRTATPAPGALRQTIGGFGGAEGLARHIREAGITHVIDATHPFAARISRNAAQACAATATPWIALGRPPWEAGAGDAWQSVPDLPAAAAALGRTPSRVFLATGRQSLPAFAEQPHHHYLVRLVDPPATPLPLPNVDVIVARGPFDTASDAALLRDHRIRVVVAKNAGGSGARAKIDAARRLGLPVVMVARPEMPARDEVRTIGDVLSWLRDHGADLGV